jgi:hypothetical protein
MPSKIAFIWMVNTNSRLCGFLLTLYVFSKIKHKDCIDLWVAASSELLVNETKKLVADSQYNNIMIQYLNVDDTSWYGYKKKLFAILPHYQFFIKCDDDLFYSQHVLDQLIDNVDILETNPDIIWIFPTASINSLTTDAFIANFVKDDAIRETIYNHFTTFDYHQYPNSNGTDDLTQLKTFFTTMGHWNADALCQYMLSSNYFNGGEHPIRHSNSAIATLNTYIINNVERIFTYHDCELEPMQGFYQAQMYIMNSDKWFEVQKLVDSNVIPRGLIDETEINWYIKYHKKIAYCLKNAFVIHPALLGGNLEYYHKMVYNAIYTYIENSLNAEVAN